MGLENICPLNYYSQKTPNKLALIAGNRKFTFFELELITQQVENYFIEKKINGLTKGALLLPNIWQGIILTIVFYRLKITLLPLNINKPPFKIIKELQASKTNFLISRKKNLEKDNCFSKIKNIALEDLPFKKNQKKTSSQIKIKKINLIKPAINLYTSGSMGKEKLAVFSLKNIFAISNESNLFLDYTSKDTWFFQLPFYHVSGLSIVFRWLIAGATMVIPAITKKNWLVEIENFPITHMSLVVTQLLDIMTSKKMRELKKLKKILIGGSSIPKVVWDLVEEYPFYPTYGLTESFGQVATYDGKKKNWLKILPSKKIKTNNKQEILIEKSSMFLGYFQTKNSFFENWFESGDKGEVKNGYLRITGRLDNQFISGGENIQAEEIENYLLDLEEIKNALVIAYPDKKWGKVPLAFITLATKKKVTTFKLKKKLSLVLEKYKIPKKYYLLPKSNEKIKRKKITEQFLDKRLKWELLQ